MFIDVHTHSDSNVGGALSIHNSYTISVKEKGLFSFGLHPWYLKADEVFDFDSTLQIVKNTTNLVAIGETGLDKITDVDFGLQLDIFRKHIQLAQACNKPLIIHCVKAFNEIRKELKLAGFENPVIFHGFNNNLNISDELFREGYYISLGAGLLTEHSNAQEVLVSAPLNQIFFETDDTKEISIADIYKKAALLLKMEISEVEKIIKLNFETVFHIKL